MLGPRTEGQPGTNTRKFLTPLAFDTDERMPESKLIEVEFAPSLNQNEYEDYWKGEFPPSPRQKFRSNRAFTQTKPQMRSTDCMTTDRRSSNDALLRRVAPKS